MVANNNNSNNNNNNATGDEDVAELTPQGGTPFGKMFSCCMPKQQKPQSTATSTAATKSKGKKTAAATTKKPATASAATASATTNPPVVAAAASPPEVPLKKAANNKADEFEMPPDMSADNNNNNNNPNNLQLMTRSDSQKQKTMMTELWRMLFAVIMMQWLGVNPSKKQRKMIKNQPEAAAAPADVSEDDKKQEAKSTHRESMNSKVVEKPPELAPTTSLETTVTVAA